MDSPDSIALDGDDKVCVIPMGGLWWGGGTTIEGTAP